jgi:signal transduction histidine kinase
MSRPEHTSRLLSHLQSSAFWRAMGWNYALVLAFSSAIALITWLIWPHNPYGQQWVYSSSIGTLIWVVIELGCLMVSPEHAYPPVRSGMPGWPKGWRGAGLVALGIAAGHFAGQPLGAWLSGWSLAETGSNSLIVTVLAGALASYYFYAQGLQKALAVARAEQQRDASEARLRLLQSQLEPHMLFNTLANLRMLIASDPAAAQHMLDRLNDFLRASLNASRATAHPLAVEFDRLRDYLALMSVRMGPRLTHALRLPDDLRAQPVPPLLLQPLVENAIKHGLEPCVEGGHIEISAAREGNTLALTVRDSGAGFDADAPRTEGHFGLTQVFERVASAYAAQGRVAVQSQPGHGTTIRITLPCRPPP